MNRKRSFGVALGIVLLTLLLAASIAPAKSTSFQGRWESIDGDGSYQWLIVSGGGSGSQLHVVYYDTAATAFGLDPDTGEPLYAGVGVGVGEVDGDQLSGALKFFRCLGPPKTIYTPMFVAEYDSASDTLSLWDSVWSRR